MITPKRITRVTLCAIAMFGAGLVRAETFTWNNSGTDFNAAGSWTDLNPPVSSGPPGINDIANFSIGNLALRMDPVVTSTIAVQGVSFGTTAEGFLLSSSGAAQLAIGTSGISASNTTGTNTISASLVLNMDESITQAAGGRLDITGPVALGGGTGTTTITIGATSGNGTINFTPSSVTIGNNISLVTNVNVTLPKIEPGAAVGEAVNAGITKSGNGTLTLTGANTYAGSTIINAGTLQASATGSNKALGSTSFVTVNTGGTLLTTTADQFGNTTPLTLAGGTFNTGGTSQSLGALSLTSSSTIDLSDGSTILNFGGNSTRTGGTLSITNWSGNLSGGGTDQVIFANIDPGFLSNINFAGFAPGAIQLQGGEIVPAPEPSTWIAAALALGAIGFTQRRKLLRLIARPVRPVYFAR